MPQHRVECECGFEEQSTDTDTEAKARRVLREHQEDCDEYVTIWKAIHSSKLV